MANELSIEYGLIINDYGKVHFYKDLLAVCDQINYTMAYFACPSNTQLTEVEGHIPVEGDGEHDHFISFGELEHGKPMPLITNDAKVIRRKLQTLIKPCAVTWGVIKTWR